VELSRPRRSCGQPHKPTTALETVTRSRLRSTASLSLCIVSREAVRRAGRRAHADSDSVRLHTIRCNGLSRLRCTVAQSDLTAKFADSTLWRQTDVPRWTRHTRPPGFYRRSSSLCPQMPAPAMVVSKYRQRTLPGPAHGSYSSSLACMQSIAHTQHRTQAKRTSSTFCAVLDEVSRKARPCRFANSSPS
jgi:hypothetical protein